MPIETDAHIILRERKGRTDVADIALGLHEIAFAIRQAAWSLGTADAATPMGAIEALGAAIKEGSESIASGLHAIADKD